MSDELLKRMAALDKELEALDGVDEPSVDETKYESDGSDAQDDYPAAEEAGDSYNEDNDQPETEGQELAAEQAGADEPPLTDDQQDEGNSESEAESNRTDAIRGLKAEKRRLARQIAGAERGRAAEKARADKLQAQLEQATRSGYEPQEPRSFAELQEAVREGDPDAQAELNELIMSQHQAQQPYQSHAPANQPAPITEGEAALFQQLEAIGSAEADQLADWVWSAQARGDQAADPQAARLLSEATRIENELQNDPAFVGQDPSSFLTEVVRRAQLAVNQSPAAAGGHTGDAGASSVGNQGGNDAAAGNRQAAPAPRKKRTPRSLSSAAGVSGVGGNGGGSSLAARYDAAADKVAFVRNLTPDEREVWANS